MFEIGQKYTGTVASFNGTWGWVEVNGNSSANKRLFAHYSNIVSDEGYRILTVGQRVKLEVAPGQKSGFQATNIVVLEDASDSDEIRHQGTVLKYFRDKRYGWVTSKAGRLFFHVNNCRDGHRIEDIPVNCEVEFLIRADYKHPGRYHAVDVRFLGAESAE